MGPFLRLCHAFTVAAAAAAAAAPSSLDGLWTTIPPGADALHDAIRVTDGVARCEHGGWKNMSVQACPATLPSPFAGRLTLNSSTQCNWTDGEPGKFWSAAGEKVRHFPAQFPPF